MNNNNQVKTMDDLLDNPFRLPGTATPPGDADGE